MRLEDQVCSLELSKKLKELGVKQESYFYWVKYKNRYEIWNSGTESWYKDKQWSAFTASELGEMLPAETYIFTRAKNYATPYGMTADVKGKRHEEFGYNLAEMSAKMLIYLIKNKLIYV